MNLELLKSVIKNQIFWYLASKYFVLMLHFLASIFIAMKLGAYYFGIWSFILLLINIGSSCNWGIGNAATILLVQHKEDKALCSQYMFNAFLLVLLTFIPPVIILGYDRIISIPLFEKYHLGSFIYAVTAIVLLQYLCTFFVNIFRVKNKILPIIIQQTLWPVTLFTSLFLASEKQLLSLLITSYTIVSILAVLVYLREKEVPFKGEWDTNIVKNIARKSFFLFLYNVCFTLIVLSTKMQTSYFYPVEEFGYFAFAFSLAQGAMLLLDSLIFLLFPKMIDLLKGNDTPQIMSSIKLLRQNYILTLHALFYLILTVCPVFFCFLRQYTQSMTPFILILFTLVMYSHCFAYNSYLLAQNKEKQFCIIVGAAFFLNNILTYAFILAGCPSQYIIIATLITYTLYSIAVNCYALYCLGFRNMKDYVKNNVPAALLLLYCGTLLLVLFADSYWYFLPLHLILYTIVFYSDLKNTAYTVKKMVCSNKFLKV